MKFQVGDKLDKTRKVLSIKTVTWEDEEETLEHRSLIFENETGARHERLIRKDGKGEYIFLNHLDKTESMRRRPPRRK